MNMRHEKEAAKKRSDCVSRKLLVVMLLALFLISISSYAVEAKTVDSVKAWWGKTKIFAFSGAFWVNFIVVYAVLFLLYTMLLSQSVGSDNTKQVMMYIVIGLIALIIATKVVAANGAPDYIWKSNQFAKLTRFILGDKTDSCGSMRGSGVYTDAKGQCRQAILMTNTNGAGLPAFLVASILFYLLFSAKASSLGIDKAGDKAGKFIPLALALLLGGLIANGGVRKSQIIILGGWAAVIFLGSTLGKSLSGDKDEKGTMKWFGFALAYALVQIIAYMLGTSLWGADVTPTDIDTWSIMKNLGLGLIIGLVFSTLAGGGGAYKAYRSAVSKERESEIEDAAKKGSMGRALGLSIPGISWLLMRKRKKKDEEEVDKDITRKIEKMKKLLDEEWDKDPPNLRKVNEIEAKLKQLQEETKQESEDIEAEQRALPSRAEASPAPAGTAAQANPAISQKIGEPQIPKID